MMIWNMERKLNKWWFAKHNRKVDSYSELSTNHYWDWLVYIDVSLSFILVFTHNGRMII